MSGVYGHLVRRGVQAASTYAAGPQEQGIDDLKAQAQSFNGQVKPFEMMVVAGTFIVFALFYASVSCKQSLFPTACG